MKLVVDYPIKYAHLPYGDINFCLAQLYKDNIEYRFNIRKAQVKYDRPLMLDNGAWEFGKSMNVSDYIEIIEELKPEYAVIPDVYRNKELTEKMTLDFFDKYTLGSHTNLMFVPQGEDIEQMIDCYNDIMPSLQVLIDTIGIPKHVGEIMNRVTFTDILYDNTHIPFKDVHFLGYWNWEELMYAPVNRDSWTLQSIDTKAPVKYALKKKYVTQVDYYNTQEKIDHGSLQLAVDSFQQRLGTMKCNT